MWVSSLGREGSPGERNGNPLQHSCLENPHGRRSLMGYSAWGRRESDRSERLYTHMCTYTRFNALYLSWDHHILTGTQFHVKHVTL